MFQDAPSIPSLGLGKQGGDETLAANERVQLRRQPMTQVEILRQTLVEVGPLQVQQRRQPVAHEGIKAVARGVAASAHEFAEMTMVRVATLGLGVTMSDGSNRICRQSVIQFARDARRCPSRSPRFR